MLALCFNWRVFWIPRPTLRGRLEAHEGGVRAAVGTSALYLSEEDWRREMEEGEMLGLATPATGTLAALPPHDPYEPNTPSKRRVGKSR